MYNQRCTETKDNPQRRRRRWPVTPRNRDGCEKRGGHWLLRPLVAYTHTHTPTHTNDRGGGGGAGRLGRYYYYCV